MTWKTIFQTYQKQEIEEKEKQVTNNAQQVSQFPLFLPFDEIQKSNSAYNPVLENIPMEKLKSFLSDDWDIYKDNFEALELWADLLFKNHLIKQGIVPDNFTAITRCNSCGDVYVPPALVNNDGSVLGCPWCWNRVKGLPIAKPIVSH